MNTNFFKQMTDLNITGVQITISKGTDKNWIVSVLPHNEHCGDDAKYLIPPFNLNGTAEELDEGFFERITVPVQAASGLMDNMEAFLKQLEEAKKQSAMEKEKADKEKREKEAKEKKYKEAMAKVDELEKEGKYRDAWMKVPDPAEFPEQAEALRKRKSSLAAKFAPDLFDTTATVDAGEQLQNEDAVTEEEPDNEELPDLPEDEDEEDNETD